jgi:hypothetical protein
MIRRLLLLSAVAYVVVVVIQKAASKRAALKATDSIAHAEWESEGGPALPADSAPPVANG